MSTVIQYTPKLIERFRSKVSTVPTPNGCLEWTAGRNTFGYGTFGTGDKSTQLAHRFAWMLVNGPIPAGMVIRHVCHNRLCCNVDHLLLGTQADNVRDMMNDGRYKNAPNTNAPYIKPTDAERFYAKVNKIPTETGCLEWLAGLRNGYGHFNIRGIYIYAHRYAWELINGPIPDGMYVCHVCDNRKCCNPAHMFLGTSTDNIRDMNKKGRQSSPPHPKGEQNSNSVLTTEDVLAIRSDKFAGWEQREIAKYFGISQASVWRVLHRRTWKHI